MQFAATVVRAVFSLATIAYATGAVGPPVAAAERDSRYQTADQRSHSRYPEVEEALGTLLAQCEVVRKHYDLRVECAVATYHDYPSMLIRFFDADAAEEYGQVMVDNLAISFCDVVRDGDVDARLVLFVRDPQMASVYACETGELSQWVSVA